MPKLKDRFVESYLLDKFSRPFVRKMNYIYTGLDHSSDIFVMSNTEDSEFKYCEPLQTTAMIKVLDPEHLTAINACFSRFGIVDDAPRIIYFGALLPILNKIRWDSPDLIVRQGEFGKIYISLGDGQEILISRPIDTHFTLTKLQDYVDRYSAVFFNRSVPSHTVMLPEAEKANKLITLPVSCQELHDAGLIDRQCRDINLILRPGQDFLVIKSLLHTGVPYTSGIRLWAEAGPHCINFGGFFTDHESEHCVVRDNIFVFPKVRQE